jgi:hypothetical protein
VLAKSDPRFGAVVLEVTMLHGKEAAVQDLSAVVST